MSAPEIDANELAANAAQFAGYQLTDAARNLAVILKMSSLRPEKVMVEHGDLVASFAMLARAEENRCLMEAGVRALQEIAEGVDMLCAFGFSAPESATDCQTEPETTFLLKGQRPEQMYDALKASFTHLHPDCSSEQHAAAMAQFARLVGL